MVDLGFKDFGYEYVNIDDCWSDKELRCDVMIGELIFDVEKFFWGIVKVVEEVYLLGLKLGIYSDVGLFILFF